MDSSITNNLPRELFKPNDQTLSISEWNTEIFNGKTPEFYAFGQNQAFANYSIDRNAVIPILSYNSGGIFEFHERKKLISAVLSGNAQTLKMEFNLNLSQANALFEYMKYVVIEFLFDGVFISKTPEEFLWGYDNNYIRNIVKINKFNFNSLKIINREQHQVC